MYHVILRITGGECAGIAIWAPFQTQADFTRWQQEYAGKKFHVEASDISESEARKHIHGQAFFLPPTIMRELLPTTL